MSLAFHPRKPLQRPTQAKVAGKLAIALRAMIHEAMPFIEACQHADMLPVSVRAALNKPHVQAWIRAEKQVRLESIRLETLNDLARIKGGDGAAAVSAIKLLEEMAGNSSVSNGATVAANTPGVTINIVNAIPTESGHAIEGQHVQALTIDADRAGEASGDHPTKSEKSS